MNSRGSLRAFVAIELPKEIRAAIAGALRPLIPLAPGVRWVSPDNIHITMKFLGNTEEDKIPLIIKVLERAAAGTPPLPLTARGTGTFPGPGRPGVLWVGLEYPALLRELHGRMDSALSQLGFAPDGRPFSPHLTVGRLRRGQRAGIRLMAGLQKLSDTSFGSFMATSLTLMKSDLRPSGPVYTLLGPIPLKG